MRKTETVSTLPKFLFVGCIGLVFDIVIFSFLTQVWQVEVTLARCCAFLCTATVTWVGNRRITFSRASKSNPLRQWKKFIIGAAFSALPNFVVFESVIWLYAEQVYVAFLLGVMVGALSNYLINSKWVFD